MEQGASRNEEALDDRVKRALARSQELFQQVVESSPSAMVMVGEAGLVEMVNAQAEQMFGYQRGELLGKPVEMLVPEHLRDNHPPLRSAFYSNPSSRPMGGGRDLYALRKDGSEFPVEIGLNPIATDQGLKVLSAIVDISTHKRMEERFRQVVESAPNAMILICPNGMIEMVNTQTETMFGYAREELVGTHMDRLVPHRFQEKHPGLRATYFTNPQSRPMGAGRDLYALRKDGSEFPVEIGLNPIETEDGLRVLSAILDISDRKQKEASIQAALQEKDLLLAEIHHRVKNNLQVVSSLLDLQSGRISDPAVAELLRDSQSRVKSMALVHQTLYQSKNFARTDMRNFLEMLVPSLMESYGMQHHRVGVSVEAIERSLPLNAAIPCGLIINEIIANAFKHAFPGDREGRVEVTLTEGGEGRVRLVISDDGVGIPETVKFNEVETLGLQLIHLLSDQLGAELSINRSNPTQFELEFPVAEEGTAA